MSLLAELQRRSVFKVAAAYLVVGWLVVQAASIAFPAFDASPSLLPGFILIVLLGFPVALVLAWAFEMTPEGVKLDTTGEGSKRIFTVAALLVALALGWFLRGGYQAPTDPRQIIITRNGKDILVDPKRLLAGEDIPVQAGDLIRLNPW